MSFKVSLPHRIPEKYEQLKQKYGEKKHEKHTNIKFESFRKTWKNPPGSPFGASHGFFQQKTENFGGLKCPRNENFWFQKTMNFACKIDF